MDGDFAGPWDLIQSGSERCDGGCLYSNTSNVEICMCNPGPVRYQACPNKGKGRLQKTPSKLSEIGQISLPPSLTDGDFLNSDIE